MAERFPTDETTLRLLIAACEINPDTGQTHLQDFLEMGSRVKSETLVGETETPFADGAVPIYDVEYEEGYAPFSEHQALINLAEDLIEARGEVRNCHAEKAAIGGSPCVCKFCSEDG